MYKISSGGNSPAPEEIVPFAKFKPYSSENEDQLTYLNPNDIESDFDSIIISEFKLAGIAFFKGDFPRFMVTNSTDHLIGGPETGPQQKPIVTRIRSKLKYWDITRYDNFYKITPKMPRSLGIPKLKLQELYYRIYPIEDREIEKYGDILKLKGQPYPPDHLDNKFFCGHISYVFCETQEGLNALVCLLRAIDLET